MWIFKLSNIFYVFKLLFYGAERVAVYVEDDSYNLTTTQKILNDVQISFIEHSLITTLIIMIPTISVLFVALCLMKKLLSTRIGVAWMVIIFITISLLLLLSTYGWLDSMIYLINSQILLNNILNKQNNSSSQLNSQPNKIHLPN